MQAEEHAPVTGHVFLYMSLQARHGQPAVYTFSTPTLSDGAAVGHRVDENGNLLVSLATSISGEDPTTNRLLVEDRSSYTNLTADTTVKSEPGRLKGVFVASASSAPTIKFWDNTSAATTVLINTFTPVAATYYPFPDVEFNTALFADVGGTLDITVFWK
jgi:hypothetical protein